MKKFPILAAVAFSLHAAIAANVTTTLSAAAATVQGIKALRQKPFKVRSLQKHHGR